MKIDGISRAKSRVGFKTYAVTAKSTEEVTSRGMFFRGTVMVAAISMVMSVFAPLGVIKAHHDPFGGVQQTSVLICHKTGSGYVTNSPSISATGGQIDLQSGHLTHQDGQDIIPPFHFNDNGTDIAFAGQNWTPENQDIWSTNGTKIGDCKGDGVVGEEPQGGTLTLVKVLAGDTTTDTTTSWTLTADTTGTTNDVSGTTGVSKAVAVGNYDLSETGPTTNYTASSWVCVEGEEDDAVPMVDSNTVSVAANQDVTCTITNTYDAPTEDPEIPNLHFIKVVCDDYSDVTGNTDAASYDDTNGNYTKFKAGTPVEPVSPTEIPTLGQGCEKVNGWNFKLSTGVENDYQDQVGNIQTVGPTVNGEFVTAISGGSSVLNSDLQAGIRTGNFWVSEVQKPGYDFATIRCYNDALNGDNMEFVNIGQDNPEDIYCIAYNIQQGPKLHFIKVVCDEYSDIVGNTDVANFDDTKGNYTQFKAGSFTEPVTPTDIPSEADGCDVKDGWNFKLSTGVTEDWQTQIGETQIVGPTVNGEYVTPIEGAGSSLIASLQTGIRTGNFWVSEVEQEGFDFATIRCYNDALNGDNLEFINIGQENPGDIYCIAYNVSEVEIQDCDDLPTGIFDRLVNLIAQPAGSCSISGYKYADTNDSNTINEGDVKLAGWEIYLDNDGNCLYTEGEQIATTDSNGFYQFTNLDSGTYYVCERQQEGWDQVLPDNDVAPFMGHQVILTNASATNINFLNDQDETLPCTPINTSVVSGTSTTFLGMLEGSTPADFDEEALYTTITTNSAAVAADSTGYPGAWSGPLSATGITGTSAIWVNNMADQPNNPADAGGNGAVESYRLFEHTFTVPAGATSITDPATLYFTADNDVTVFFDGTEIATHNTHTTLDSVELPDLTAGQHTLRFAVHNLGVADINDNPTGLLYSLQFAYCEGNNGGGGDGGNDDGRGGDGDGSSTSSGSRRGGNSDDDGEVLGDNTNTPSPLNPQVLGDSTTELPRTGMPMSILFTVLAILGIVFVPKFMEIKE